MRRLAWYTILFFAATVSVLAVVVLVPVTVHLTTPVWYLVIFTPLELGFWQILLVGAMLDALLLVGCVELCRRLITPRLEVPA